jgi:ubiquinone/menaquinone biosynthesis C-methylase UbiE
MSAEAKVAGYYNQPRLEERILRAVEQAGRDSAQLTAADLAPVDEFHIGGIESTKELAARMELKRGMQVLDVGCGIGGPARYFASEHGCKVSAIDLTEEFVSAAKGLTRMVKLDHLVEYRQGSALAMPYEVGTFDRAYMIHVGMNIADKTGVYREVRRVLKPGGLFVIFDLMRAGNGAIQYPVPWALTEETSFVVQVKEYRSALEEAGFRVEEARDRREFGVEFTEKSMARIAQSGPPALGLHLLMGETTAVMLGNTLRMLKQEILTPVELYGRAV